MGLFGKNEKVLTEKCPACGFEIVDDHELWEYHVKNTHPSTKSCTKCSGTAYYRHHRAYGSDMFDLFSYICADCGFVLETWKTVEGIFDDNIYMPAKHRSKPSFK